MRNGAPQGSPTTRLVVPNILQAKMQERCCFCHIGRNQSVCLPHHGTSPQLIVSALNFAKLWYLIDVNNHLSDDQPHVQHSAE